MSNDKIKTFGNVFTCPSRTCGTHRPVGSPARGPDHWPTAVEIETWKSTRAVLTCRVCGVQWRLPAPAAITVPADERLIPGHYRNRRCTKCNGWQIPHWTVHSRGRDCEYLQAARQALGTEAVLLTNQRRTEALVEAGIPYHAVRFSAPVFTWQTVTEAERQKMRAAGKKRIPWARRIDTGKRRAETQYYVPAWVAKALYLGLTKPQTIRLCRFMAEAPAEAVVEVLAMYETAALAGRAAFKAFARNYTRHLTKLPSEPTAKKQVA